MNSVLQQSAQTLPPSARQQPGRRWLIAALATALPLSTLGSAVVTGAPAAHAAASTVNYAETFQSTGQSAFPTSVEAGQLSVPIIPATPFSGGFSVGDIKAGFGAEVSVSGSGTLGLTATFGGVLGEKVNVSYPLDASFSVDPAIDGSTTIRTSWVPQSGGQLTVSGTGLNINLSAHIGLSGSASAKGCLFSKCSSSAAATLIPTRDYSIYSGALNGDSEILPLGLSGSVGGQVSQTTTSLGANNALTATSTTPLDDVNDDMIDTLVEGLTGIPTSADFSQGPLSASLTSLAGGLHHSSNLNNNLSFLPKPWTTLEFSAPASFTVYQPNGTPEAAMSTPPGVPGAQSALFPLGDSISITPAAGVTQLTVTPVLTINDNTFTNATTATSIGSFWFKTFEASVGAFGYNESGGPVYQTSVASFGCPNYPLIQALEVGTVAMSNCTAPGVSDSWTLGGFSSHAEAPFTVAFPSTGPTYYKIVNANSGDLLDVQNAFTADGTPIIQYHDDGGTNQQWQLEPVTTDSGCYTIVNRNSGKLLSIPGASTIAGTPLIQDQSDGSLDSQWRLVPVGSSQYQIISCSDRQLVDVQYGSSADGQSVIQYPSDGGTNQRWQFEATS